MAVRGYDIAELMGRVSFGQAVYLILRGELPSPEIGRLMDAMLVSSIDHGATPRGNHSAVASELLEAAKRVLLELRIEQDLDVVEQHHIGPDFD